MVKNLQIFFVKLIQVELFTKVVKFTEEQRELKIKYKDLPYEQRDHALFAAFFPYNKPKYAISVVIEHGGSGASIAAPIAKRTFDYIYNQKI